MIDLDLFSEISKQCVPEENIQSSQEAFVAQAHDDCFNNWLHRVMCWTLLLRLFQQRRFDCQECSSAKR
jgi:hypothetical protein